MHDIEKVIAKYNADIKAKNATQGGLPKLETIAAPETKTK